MYLNDQEMNQTWIEHLGSNHAFTLFRLDMLNNEHDLQRCSESISFTGKAHRIL